MAEKTLYTHVEFTPIGEPYLSIQATDSVDPKPVQARNLYSISFETSCRLGRFFAPQSLMPVLFFLSMLFLRVLLKQIDVCSHHCRAIRGLKPPPPDI